MIDTPGYYCFCDDITFSPASINPLVPVSFTGGGGSGASGYAAVTQGVIVGVVLTNSGSGYTSAPTPVFGGFGSGVNAIVEVSGGVVADVIIIGGGTGYQDTMRAAITIAADNVVLDFKGYTLSQLNKNNLYVNGVVVNPGLDNVDIINGTIRDFSFCGIQAGQTPVVADQSFLTNLHIANINTFNNGLQDITQLSASVSIGGIVLYNARFVNLNNSNLNENFLAGLFTVNVSNLEMENSHFDATNWANSQYPYGSGGGSNWPQANAFYYQADGTVSVLENVKAVNCTFDDTTGTGLVHGFQAVDMSFSSILLNNVVFQGCSFSGSTAILTDPDMAPLFYPNGDFESMGIFVTTFSVYGMTMSDCKIRDITCVLDAPGTFAAAPIAVGIRFHEFEGSPIVTQMSGINIDNCQISNLSAVINQGSISSSAPALLAAGIALSGGHGVTITNTDAFNTNVQNNSGSVVTAPGAEFESIGAAVYGGSDIYVGNCKFMNNIYTGDFVTGATAPESIGLAFLGSNNILVEDCFATNQTQAGPISTGGNFALSAGFASAGGSSDVVYRRCVALHIKDTAENDGIAAGFTTKHSNGSNNTSIMGTYLYENCVADNITTPNSKGVGFDLFRLVNGKVLSCRAESNSRGFVVSDNNSNNIVLADNIAIGNFVNGYLDTSTGGTSNRYLGNYASGNGTNFSITPVTIQLFTLNSSGNYTNVSGDNTHFSSLTNVQAQ